MSGVASWVRTGCRAGRGAGRGRPCQSQSPRPPRRCAGCRRSPSQKPPAVTTSQGRAESSEASAGGGGSTQRPPKGPSHAGQAQKLLSLRLSPDQAAPHPRRCDVTRCALAAPEVSPSRHQSHGMSWTLSLTLVPPAVSALAPSCRASLAASSTRHAPPKAGPRTAMPLAWPFELGHYLPLGPIKPTGPQRSQYPEPGRDGPRGAAGVAQ